MQSGVDLEQGWGRGNDVAEDDSDDDASDNELGQVTVYEQGKGCGFPCVITPSSLATELAPDLPHSKVAEICLGMSAACFCTMSCSRHVPLTACLVMRVSSCTAGVLLPGSLTATLCDEA